jgi:CRISPR-associated protein (TIGR02584 family)
MPESEHNAPPTAIPENRAGSMEAPPDVVLLAVTGMSPAILTETVWALAQLPEPIVPTRVQVVTTLEGRRNLERLFNPVADLGGLSPWEALRQAIAHKGHSIEGRLRFGLTGADVQVIADTDPSTGTSRELSDLRTPAENLAAADTLLDAVRGLTANPDVRVIGSIAGGRKTMGALLYACFTLAAREEDQLTHVLVSEPFETLPGFWFPDQPGPDLIARDGSTHAPGEARVELAEIAFVPLRNLFHQQLGRPVGSFSRLVEACRLEVREQSTQHLRVTIDTQRTSIEINLQRLDLAPREHLILLFLATRAKRRDPDLGAFGLAPDPLGEFQQELRRQADPRHLGDWRHGACTTDTLEEQDLRRALSSLRKRLRGAGPDGAQLAGLLPERGRFTLDLPPAQIHLR